jgi:3-oxoacyl-[acyl-carrier protein] reductase
MFEGRFAGKTAIVTGGGSGIGLHIVRRLAREGAAVAVFDRDAEAMERAFRGAAGIETRAVDIGDEASVERALRGVVESRGGLDVVVHCAAVVGPTSRKITEVSVAEFDEVCRVNLRGSFIVTRLALREMKEKGRGRILLFASIAGKEGNAGMSPYSSTKAGVIGLVKSVGKEFAESAITINAIAPAVIRTPMVEATDPAQVKYMTDRIPARRTGTLDEAAALACWIVSDEASFCTGFTFDLSGGRAVY